MNDWISKVYDRVVVPRPLHAAVTVYVTERVVRGVQDPGRWLFGYHAVMRRVQGTQR